MSIPWIFAIASLMIISMYEVGGLYHDAGLWKESQVAIDNLALKMGQTDREIFNKLRLANNMVAGIEPFHHTAHTLKNSPWPWISGPAQAADVAFEAQIRVLINVADVASKTLWRINTARGWVGVSKVQAKGLVPVGGTVDRDSDIPVRKKTCWFCRMENAFETTKSKIRTDLKVRRVPRDLKVGMELVGKKLSGFQSWSYLLDVGK